MTKEEAKNWLNKLYARADITDEYGDMEDMQPYEEAVNMAIQALEQTRWIHVSERLPEKSGYYWCTFGGTGLTGSDYYTTESDAKKLFDDPEEYAGWRSQNVIAWMPLLLKGGK